MRPIFQSTIGSLLALLVLALHTQQLGHSQANLPLKLERSKDGLLTLSWPVERLVPAPGAPIFATYQLWGSTNFVDWTALGTPLFGGEFEGRGIQFSFRDGRGGVELFFRVESVIDFSNTSIVRFRLARGNFEGATFFGADAFGADFTRANLRRAKLQAADFRNATLDGADLRFANCFGATFAAASLEGADLRNADLSYSDWTDADLDSANLANADLRSAILITSDAAFTRLHGSRIDGHTLLEPKLELVWHLIHGSASNRDLRGEDISVSDLSGASLQGRDLSGTDLRGSDLQGANLAGANLLTANINFVDWRRCTIDQETRLSTKARLVWEINNNATGDKALAGVDLSVSSFFGVQLPGRNLQAATFTSSILAAGNFQGATLAQANFRSADCFLVNFQGADLRNANFTAADLTEANFRGADMTGAITAGAIFSGTTMPDGTVR